MSYPASAYVLLSAETLTPVVPRDRLTMRASYCSHRDQTGAVVFDPIYFGLLWDKGDKATIDRCLDVKRTMGVDAVQLCIQGGYPAYADGRTYDFRQRPDVYARLCHYIYDAGFTPVMLVGTADGGTHVEIYNGTMQRALNELGDLAASGWYCAGYEQDLDRGGGYNARQMDDALLLMRDELGTEALLMLWLQPNRCTPASYWGSDKNQRPSTPEWNPTELKWITSESNPHEGAWIEADDPYGGDEQGAYYMSGGLEIDGLWYQTAHGNDGPAYVTGGPGLDAHGQPRYFDRLIEIADRFLAPGTPMPRAQGFLDTSHLLHTSGVAPSLPGAPDWFHMSRARGRVLCIVGETVPYEYSRDQCSDDAVRQCARDCEGLGLPVQGCWQP